MFICKSLAVNFYSDWNEEGKSEPELPHYGFYSSFQDLLVGQGEDILTTTDVAESEYKNSEPEKSLQDLSEDQLAAIDALIFEETAAICDPMDWEDLMRANGGKHSTKLVQNCFKAIGRTLTDPSTKALSEQPCKEPIQFHVVWVRSIPRTARLGFLSVIYSHPPGCAELNLWTTDDETGQRANQTLSPYIPEEQLHIRTINEMSLVRDIQATFPEMKPLLEEKKALFSNLLEYGGVKLPAYSDALRFLLLAAYGGVYVDADVLVMRSFRPLLSRDFWY